MQKKGAQFCCYNDGKLIATMWYGLRDMNLPRIFNRWHFYLHHQRIRYEADAQSSYSYISRGKTISYHGFTNTTNLKSRITEQATVEKAFNTWVSPWKPSRRKFLIFNGMGALERSSMWTSQIQKSTPYLSNNWFWIIPFLCRNQKSLSRPYTNGVLETEQPRNYVPGIQHSQELYQS
jgi:hypothetical protein